MKRLYWIIQGGPKSSDEGPSRDRKREGTDIERWPQEIRIQLQLHPQILVAFTP